MGESSDFAGSLGLQCPVLSELLWGSNVIRSLKLLRELSNQ